MCKHSFNGPIRFTSQCGEVSYTLPLPTAVLRAEITCSLCGAGASSVSLKEIRSATFDPMATPRATPIPTTEAVQPTPITIDNFFVASYGIFTEVNSIPEGFTLFFSSRSSKYYRNHDGSKLARASDHWGRDIRNCSWHLYGYPRMNCFKWSKVYGKRVFIGVIAIDCLSVRDKAKERAAMKTPPKKAAQDGWGEMASRVPEGEHMTAEPQKGYRGGRMKWRGGL